MLYNRSKHSKLLFILLHAGGTVGTVHLFPCSQEETDDSGFSCLVSGICLCYFILIINM